MSNRRLAFTLISLALIAAAVGLATVNTADTPGAGSTPPSRRPSTPAALRELDLHRARSVARRFLRGYLAVVYGNEPTAVPDAAPGIAAALAKRRRVPPALARLHPRIVAVDASPAGEVGAVAITATVSDDEVLTYSVHLLVAVAVGDRMVVTKVGEG